MPHADELNFALSLAKRFRNRIDAVANEAKNMRNIASAAALITALLGAPAV